MREAVDALILEEMAHMEPEDYLAEFPAPSTTFSSELIEHEVQRIAQGQPGPSIDFEKIFNHVEPPADADAATYEAWETALSRAKVAVEAQRMRSINLELMSRFGVDAWKAHVEGLDGMHSSMKSRVTELQAKIDTLNAARKQQEEAAQRTRTLIRKWRETMETNVQAELACQDATQELKRLKALAAEAGLLG